MMAPALDAAAFRGAMRNLAGGVAIVTTGQGDDRRGLTMTAITSVSADPPSLLVCINAASGSHDAVLRHGSFAVNVLGPEHADLALRFAGQAGLHGVARFEGEVWEVGLTGAPLLSSALCSLDCALDVHQRAGSHGIFIGRVKTARHRFGEPLLNFQGGFRALAVSAG
ncbi:flavin reductase family protein [Muricoccus radiodurans]|uniref:flavin reductase family protein n=1 Tax=Muricoccus radiodurans TaxID=2231721 RepID=UPI003CF8ADE5